MPLYSAAIRLNIKNKMPRFHQLWNRIIVTFRCHHVAPCGQSSRNEEESQRGKNRNNWWSRRRTQEELPWCTGWPRKEHYRLREPAYQVAAGPAASTETFDRCHKLVSDAAEPGRKRKKSVRRAGHAEISFFPLCARSFRRRIPDKSLLLSLRSERCRASFRENQVLRCERFCRKNCESFFNA